VLDRILFHVYRQAELFGQPDGTCDMTVRLEDYVRSGRRGADRYLAVLDYRHEAGGAVCGRIREMAEMPSGETGGSAKAAVNWKSLLIQSGFLFLMMALFVQGALSDGVTTWVPTYISETYGLSAILAITSTMVIPVFNLLGVYLASFANLHWFRNEVWTAGAFFVVSAAAILVLRMASGRSMAVICFLTVRKWIAYRKKVLQIWKE